MKPLLITLLFMVGCARRDAFPELTKACIQHHRKYHIFCTNNGDCYGVLFAANETYGSAKADFTEHANGKTEIEKKLIENIDAPFSWRNPGEIVENYDGGAQ